MLKQEPVGIGLLFWRFICEEMKNEITLLGHLRYEIQACNIPRNVNCRKNES